MKWRAMDSFLVALGATFVFFISAMLAALALKFSGTTVNSAQASFLLNYAYWTTYPTGLTALGALLWHFVKFYRGDYATA
jgi:hypothetical protein